MSNHPATQEYTPERQVSQRGRPASPRQKIIIAQLCMALGETEPIEERPMSIGEAGLLINRMLADLRAGGR